MEHKFIKNRDIVLFSFEPWDTEMGTNFKDMAFELSKHNRVLYVNRALDRVSLWKHKNNPAVKTRFANIKKGIDEISEVQPCLWVQNPRTIVESINWIPFAWFHNLFNRINNKRLARQINKAIDQLEFSNVILINDNDFIRGRYLKQMVKCTDYIFYIRDFMLGVGYFREHGPRLESGLLKEVSMVATNSAYLADYAKKLNPNSFDIGQGCNLKQAISYDTSVPEDIRSIKKPIIGYAGYVSAWRIDVEIIKYIAEKLPDCSVVLIGPVDELFKTDILKHFTNIHFLGIKPASDLSNYIHHFDVCINPQALNKITIGNYPRKVDEYLAMGKPVVATDTEAMKLFEPYIWLCTTKAEYVEKILQILKKPEQCMSEREKERRRSFALSHTWTNSIGRLGDAYFATKNKPSRK